MNAVILEGDSSLTGSDAPEPASQAKGVASVAQVCCMISVAQVCCMISVAQVCCMISKQYKRIVRYFK